MVHGEVDLPIRVGSQVFDSTFYVMDICPSYSCLLGRPWIHKAGAVTSTLHQKLKYPVRGKIVTVQGEEEYMVSHLNSFRDIEMDGEFIETPFQHFEEVPPTLAAAETMVEEDVPLKMASLKDARAVVEKEAQRAVRKARIRRPPVFITNPGVNAIEDDVEESEFDSWIYPTTDSGPSNWTAKDFTPITFVTQ